MAVWFVVIACLLMAAHAADARISPDADHTVWVTIDSTPVGAEVFSIAEADAKPMRLGSTPCRLPVDLYWGTKWFVKRWELLTIQSPGGVFRGELRGDGAYDILLKTRLTKPGYLAQELDMLALTLNHPGKNWDGKALWPREVRLHTELVPDRAKRADVENSDAAMLRKVWVAQSGAAGEVSSVVIRANVEGAEVWVDGRRVAVAPVEVVLQEGEHVLEVRKPGYVAARRSVVIGADERLEYEAFLERER